MRIEQVETYSDASNAAILRHPGRRFPGVLIQGDTLRTLLIQVQEVHQAGGALDDDSRDGLRELVERLQALLHHYNETLTAHGLDLP
jgi:hypothetical protein